MEILDIVLFLGLVAFITGTVKLITAFRKKMPKKQAAALMAGSVLLMGASTQILGPTHFLDLSKDTYTTDNRGFAMIEGSTNEDAQVKIDGQTVPHSGTFDYEFALDDDGEKTLTIISTRDGQAIEKTVTIKPAKAYLAYLNEEADKERLILAETSLARAESEPTQENYDVAFTNIKALSSEHDLGDRLTIVKKHLPIYAAIQKAETSKSRGDYDEAVNAVKLASLNQTGFTQRLKDLDTAIKVQEEKARIEKLLADAKSLVEKAESSKSETDYQAAVTSLQALPEKDQQLDQRLASVHHHIETEKQAIAQAQAAEAAAAAQAQQQAAIQPVMGQQPAVSETVLVTPTGSKYHSRKCGNGNYSPATLEQAQQKGLTACSKCF